jgi:hypothetical protein
LSGEDLEKTLPMAEAIRAVKDAFLQALPSFEWVSDGSETGVEGTRKRC